MSVQSEASGRTVYFTKASTLRYKLQVPSRPLPFGLNVLSVLPVVRFELCSTTGTDAFNLLAFGKVVSNWLTLITRGNCVPELLRHPQRPVNIKLHGGCSKIWASYVECTVVAGYCNITTLCATVNAVQVTSIENWLIVYSACLCRTGVWDLCAVESKHLITSYHSQETFNFILKACVRFMFKITKPVELIPYYVIVMFCLMLVFYLANAGCLMCVATPIVMHF